MAHSLPLQTHQHVDDESCCAPGADASQPKELFTVLTPADAYARLAEHLPRVARSERVSTADALGRVLVDDLVSPEDLPSFPRSTMDGFAVRAADTFGASEGLPAYLSIAGEVLMGRRPETSVPVGQAARIATGGMIPDGANAVVMVEHTQEVDATTIEVVRPVAPGENVIQVGEDVIRGMTLMPKGRTLRPQDIGGLLALGVCEIGVATRLKVAILGSGDEIVPPDQVPGPGQIRDINSYTLAALTRRAGHEPLLLGVVPDVYEEFELAAKRALDLADVVVVSAGSSVSTRDMTAQVISTLGLPGVLVHGVSLKPGKPTILAVADGTPVFGLPGNPVSCMVTFDLFVAPTLAAMTGAEIQQAERAISATLARNIASAAGREDYVQVRLERRDDRLWADPVFGKSNLIYSLVRSDGLVRIPLDKAGLAAGESVEVKLF